MQLAEQTQRNRVPIQMCVRLLGRLGEPVALEAGHVCWGISKESSRANVTLLVSPVFAAASARSLRIAPSSRYMPYRA